MHVSPSFRPAPTLARGLILLGVLGSVSCAAEPSPDDLSEADVDFSPRSVTGAPYIHLELTTWETPGSTDILLYQEGVAVAIDVVPDATTGVITIEPQSPLDPTVPYELKLSAGLVQKMVPYGPLWITPGDPDCDEAWEYQVDDDEDGLPDCSEKVGTYYWGMPLNYWGARPDQTDVFVELRYLFDERAHARPWMRPWPQALDKVRAEFLAHDYVVHFDVGDLYEGTAYDGYEQGVDWSGEFNLSGESHGFTFPDGGNIAWVTPEPGCETTPGVCVSNDDGWETWMDDNFLTSYASQMMPGRERSFYFAMFGYNASAAAASGRTLHGGRNTIITLGHFDGFVKDENPNGPWNLPSTDDEVRNKIINYQAATLMHEMGHMFGLLEGGDLQLSGKPNYISSMSYAFMFSGLPQDDADLQLRHQNAQRYYVQNLDCDPVFLSQLAHGPLGDPAQFHIGYSSGQASTLSEAELHESAGIGAAPWGMTGPIDWNCDGDASDTLFDYNVTQDGFYPSLGLCGGPGVLIDTEVADHDDWGSLVLYHREHFVSGQWPNAGLPFECPFPIAP